MEHYATPLSYFEAVNPEAYSLIPDPIEAAQEDTVILDKICRERGIASRTTEAYGDFKLSGIETIKSYPEALLKSYYEDDHAMLVEVETDKFETPLEYFSSAAKEAYSLLPDPVGSLLKDMEDLDRICISNHYPTKTVEAEPEFQARGIMEVKAYPISLLRRFFAYDANGAPVYLRR